MTDPIFHIDPPAPTLPIFRSPNLPHIRYKSLYSFFADKGSNTLVLWDEDGVLKVATTVPSRPLKEVAYFLKTDQVTITPDCDFDAKVQHGVVRGKYLESLVVAMNNVYIPLLEDTSEWPKSVQHEFMSGVNKFMAVINDLEAKNLSITRLYIPRETKLLRETPLADQDAFDEEFVHRMEAVLIQWTRQIQELLASLKGDVAAEYPLDELRFWQSRCDNMAGLGSQLQEEDVAIVTNFLERIKSPYVAAFQVWSTRIKDGIERAASNLKFLKVLEEPCTKLASASLQEIKPVLFRVLNLVQMIATHSPHYNSADQITNLLRLITNSTIKMCCGVIDVDGIFNGDVALAESQLKESIQGCNDWKDVYGTSERVFSGRTSKGWPYDSNRIFAQIDAFIQRCNDLLDICNASAHFGRKVGAEVAPLPSVRGSAAADVRGSFNSVAITFGRAMANLQEQSAGTILDVKNPSWYELYNGRFKTAIKDLEVMVQNLLTQTLARVTEVDATIEILELFEPLASRDIVQRTFDKGMERLINLFTGKVQSVKSIFSEGKQNPPIRQLCEGWPDNAGAALWAQGLRTEILALVAAVNDAGFLELGDIGKKAVSDAQEFASSLQDYTMKLHGAWYGASADCSDKLLNVSLMTRGTAQNKLHLKLNFDPALLRLFEEITYFSKLGLDIPSSVNELYVKQEDLRHLREHVLLVVRDYNTLIDMLSVDERKLFRERIRFLDKKIQPGLTRLTWSSKGISEFYVADSRLNATALRHTVQEYLDSNKTIASVCSQISEKSLLDLESRKVYVIADFAATQRKQNETSVASLQKLHAMIVKILKNSSKVFKNDGLEVQRHWGIYVEKVDLMLEESIKLCAKKSLQALSAIINGDGKTDPLPAFKAHVMLKGEATIDLDATYDEHRTYILETANSICQVADSLSRLPSLLVRDPKHQRAHLPYVNCILQDPECKKLVDMIRSGFSSTLPDMNEYVNTWDSKYSFIWCTAKDPFIQRYAEARPPLFKFEADIGRYDELANSVQKEETLIPLNFMLLDSSPLKHTLVEHCTLWRSKFTDLLYDMACTDLKELTEFVTERTEKLKIKPDNLDEMCIQIEFVQGTTELVETTEHKFAPISEQFAILDKREIPIAEDVQDSIEVLPKLWSTFQEELADAEERLEESKVFFKNSLLKQSEQLGQRVATFRDTFLSSGPFHAEDITASEAVAKLAESRSEIASIRDTETQLKANLKVFELNQEMYKEIADCESDLTYLDSLWGIADEFDTNYGIWSVTQFDNIDTDDMEQQAASRYKKLNKLNREVSQKGKDWGMVQTYLNKLLQFKNIMPLISQLKNKAMRDRHWTELMTEVGKKFDYKADDFTLGVMIDLGLDAFAEQVETISGAASKELGIENNLKEIVGIWKEDPRAELLVSPYKDKKGVFKMGTADEFMQLLEDNQVSLGTMKSSRFVKPFIKEVDQWEKILSLILEVIEMGFNVQRQWMYLENIFNGEDIRKQLPRETALFDSISAQWLVIVAKMEANPNAKVATSEPGILKTLTTMNDKLELIQKALDQYLEAKRQVFPRFYFVSNDDLLEILGQSRNPQAIQVHLLKCFDNVKALELQQPAIKSKPQDAVGMFSADGEFVPFSRAVTLSGAVENWLNLVEDEMRNSLRAQMSMSKVAHKKTKRDKWIKDWPGQIVIAISQLGWTADTFKAITGGKKKEKVSAKKGLKSMKRKQISFLKKLTEAVRVVKDKVQKKKLVALITIEVHSRDVLDRLSKINDITPDAFEWMMQLRYYWEKTLVQPDGDCVVRQTNSKTTYGYEYLGNNGRLVITPLTDRCYMTLTTALHLTRGGSPKGPAGTGKTETVKDLGKALGDYVIVVNCSEGLDYKSIGRMLSGLGQTGAWGCFDEFNRINIEVLSVVAQQVLCLVEHQIPLNCENPETRFVFEGIEIKLRWSCGLFITMNPGYAGRTELPDNLKSLFRPISMMVPDSGMIAEILLMGVGFGMAKLLAKKVFTCYALCEMQLSKQFHYDFKLRALVSIIRNAGGKRNRNPEMPEDEILVMACKDMNVAKMTADDLPLFLAIMGDLFPGIETPDTDYGLLKDEVIADLKREGFQATDFIVTKALQLYETKTSRHSVMMVGNSQAGKTTAYQTLARAMSACKAKDIMGLPKAQGFPMNPKALSNAEIYGEFNIDTLEWTDGILSSLFRTLCADEKEDQKWIVFDGPVDADWIESMNSVMDDNKLLTLINGERIQMPDQVSLLFECQDLAVASPATVSRAGFVFFDVDEMGWSPYVESWLAKRTDQTQVPIIRECIDKYVHKCLEFVRKNCTEMVYCPPTNKVITLCNLLEALLTEANGVPAGGDGEERTKMIQNWFLFSVIWSIGGAVEQPSRKKVDNFLREIEGQFPSKDTVYEYAVDVKTKTWIHWEQRLKSNWSFPPTAKFYKILVPTIDTLRYEFLLEAYLKNDKPALVTGPVGTGKTQLVQSVLDKFDPERISVLNINMSSQTTSNNVQEIIEGAVEKRTKGVFVPIGNKKMYCFVDDLNMPAKQEYGDQPPLELLRQWMEYGVWYDREKQVVKSIKNMHLVGAMGPPGGGRTYISMRVQSRFSVINMTFPSDSSIFKIFGTIFGQRLQGFDESVKPLCDQLTQATLQIYKQMAKTMLPTPAKIHYLFNLRDISKVFQGLFRAHKDFHDTPEVLQRLWLHESYRVFGDRLVGEQDNETFDKFMEEALSVHCDMNVSALCPNQTLPMFAQFLQDRDEPVYEDVKSLDQLRAVMDDKVDDYNMTPGYVAMDLVFFKYCLEHITRITRVIALERGNMLLIGVGGSGRSSASRLAASILEYKIFNIEVTKTYRVNEFREDLKLLFRQAGVENKATMFLFNDTQIVDEAMLELINNILSSGTVANLFTPEELEEIYGELAPLAKKAGVEQDPPVLFKWLIERVRNNLHIVLAMSPVGEAFRNRMRMYPGLINCTTTDYFSPWPDDALMAVAEKFLDEVSFAPVTADADADAEEEQNVVEAQDAAAEAEALTASVKQAVSKGFATIHQSVVKMSARMEAEIKRVNYVTPTNYLELVSGYKTLLAEKRKEIGDAASKLSNGLEKIDDTRIKVEAMGKELVITQGEVEAFQKEVDEFLVQLVEQRKDADDQQKAVSIQADKISIEAKACGEMATAAQADLDEALPALEAAVLALNGLNKGDITEIKSYSKPPPLVATVLEAVMILRKKKPDWTTAKKDLGEGNFIKQLLEFDKDNIAEGTRKKIQKYINDPAFVPDVVGKVSNAAKSLCMWVRAMDVYSRIFKTVKPKKEALENATSTLAKKQKMLAKAEGELAKVTAKVAQLQATYESKLKTKDELQSKAAATKLKLERAGMLVSGLAGERTRWAATVKVLQANLNLLVGDCLMASGFLSYLGPFISEFRNELVDKIWIPTIRDSGIPYTANFDMATFLANPTDVRFWNIQGLPADQFSTENGVIVTRGKRWPLMIDPQGQAIKWIKKMEGERGLKIIDLQMSNFLRTLENSIQFGTPVLLQNVGEVLDPSLEPILNKAFVKVGGRLMIKLGEKEVDFNPDFKFYITTKMSNPIYGPDISTKVTLVNFAVVLKGLESQMLGVVVQCERPDLEKQKSELTLNIASGKKKLVDLEDRILYLLANVKGSLLDDATLIDTLNTSKVTSTAVNEQLEISETTEKEIDTAREGYRLCANRAAVLFFVLNDIERIDPMYQFALDAYIKLFNVSIAKAKKNNSLQVRIENVNEFHSYAVYRNACRGLFEKDKLLFSLHLAAKVLESLNKVNMVEYNFFLRGGQVLDRAVQVPNPATSWISEPSWDNVTEMDKGVPKFSGLANSFEQDLSDWKGWYQSDNPETAALPGEWDNACNELQKMLLVRAIRPDRVALVATNFIVNNLGQRFTEPPPLDMNAVLDDSSPQMPLIFVLSAGVDPTRDLINLAQRKGMGDKLNNLSLGQGQAPIAEAMIARAREEGAWVFLANAHLSLSWMPRLAKIVETFESEPPHKDFLLWLSSSPSKDFPISILQAGIKMTTEPPKGLKANVKRIYATLTEEQFESCGNDDQYKKLMLSLSFFHSILIVRRKFQMLGWNVVYPFNDSDFIISELLMRLYLDEYESTPWEALRYLIAGVMYGGHVTDDQDRRLVLTYINDMLSPGALEVGFKLSYSPHYTIIEKGSLQHYKDHINQLPAVDPPEAFGQHPNADISSMIRETTSMLGTLVSLQPVISSGGGVSSEDKVFDMAATMETQVPPQIDLEAAKALLSSDPHPLNVVLFQEIARFNALTVQIKIALIAVQKGVKGLVVMSSELEDIFTNMLAGIVPPAWKLTYPSMKPLAAWLRDLIERIEMFNTWAVTGRPPVIFWMSAFSFPTGFLTAVLQATARGNNVPIDSLAWEFPVMALDEANIKDPPKDGAYIRGLYLEGASWNRKDSCLAEAAPMQLVTSVPIIHFKPVETLKVRVKKGYYACPCYYYPNRAGEGGAKAWSFVIAVELKSGSESSDHWIKRGVALLMSLET